MTTASARPLDAGWRNEVAALLRLSVPIMVAQGGLTMMGLTDTFMIGRVSATEMGGVALGNVTVLIFLVFGIGLTMGTEPLVSQANGAGEPGRAYGWYQQALWAAALTSVPTVAVVVACVLALPWLGISEAVVSATVPYLLFRVPSIPANAMYGAARSYLTSMQRTQPIVIAVVTANVANVALDYVFLFVLDMGAAGVGAATSVCWIVMFGVTGWAAAAGRPSGVRPWSRLDPARMRRVLRLGLPVGLQLTAEVGVFGLIGLLVARMGEVPLGGHQIAMSLASFTFMSAVGIAVGAATLVGHCIGAGRSYQARRIGLLAIALGGLFMATGGVCFVLFDTELAQLFAPADEAVVRVGARLLQIGALFSISDGVQAVSTGALRGAGDTKSAFYANAAGHWLLGLPLGLLLAERAGLGVRGLWLGLTIGLTAVAVSLTLRFVALTRGRLARVE